MTTMTELGGYLSPTEAANAIGVSTQTVRLWVRAGKMPALRTPNGIVLRREDVEEVAKARTAGRTTP